ncbi:MAG: hypothetical protein JWN44_4922 [Myxococcales bacterium]|nr:hypothetical protein [Myxococcales bacterium]
MLGSVVALCLWTTASYADKAADDRLAFVDDEPMSSRAHDSPRAHAPPRAQEPARARSNADADRRRPDDVGQLRPVSVSGPMPTAVDSGPMSARDHDVAAPHLADAPNANAADLMTELAARQLAKEARRHQRDIDGCIVAAQRRHPAAVGTLTLSITVADRAVANVVVAADAVHDFELTTCLVRTAKSFKLSLAAAQVAWPITLAPSAAR